MIHELNEKENIVNLSSILICKKTTPLVLDCVKNAINAYRDDSEDDLLGMDESDKELCNEFITSFESIYKKIEEFISENIDGSFNLKLSSNEIEAMQSALELYCIDMDEENVNENNSKLLELYDKVKKLNHEILNKTNPKYIEMLNNFENTSLK